MKFDSDFRKLFSEKIQDAIIKSLKEINFPCIEEPIHNDDIKVAKINVFPMNLHCAYCGEFYIAIILDHRMCGGASNIKEHEIMDIIECPECNELNTVYYGNLPHYFCKKTKEITNA